MAQIQTEKFTFEALPKMFGGVLPELFAREAKRVILDCKERFEIDKERTIDIQFKIAPKENTQGDEVDVYVNVSSKIIKKQTPFQSLRIRANGDAVFASSLFENVDPSTGEVK